MYVISNPYVPSVYLTGGECNVVTRDTSYEIADLTLQVLN